MPRRLFVVRKLQFMQGNDDPPPLPTQSPAYYHVIKNKSTGDMSLIPTVRGSLGLEIGNAACSSCH